jgi:hypothetical protein
MDKILKVAVFVIFLNILVVNYFLFFKTQPVKSEPKQTTETCPSVCTNIIQDSIAKIPTPVCSCSVPTPQVISKTKTLSKSVSFVTVPGSGSSLSNSWANLPGTEFNFNPNDYPSLKEAYFEANMKLLNGNGQAFLRLFDVTAGIEVWGSEIQTNKQDSTFMTSAKLTLRSDNHLYRVQAKSLTADTAVFNSGRLKLITEN